jgi:excisionase family DNA binding protein
MSDDSNEYAHLLTTAQASQKSGRHVRTIVSWIRDGKLPAMRLPGGRGQYLIEPADLEQLILILKTPVPYAPKEK